MNPASAQRGFTMIEVLVAIALFAIAAVTLTSAFANALLSLSTLHEEAALEADLRWVRREVLLEPDLETFEQGGEITTLRHGRATWEPIVEQTGVLDLFRVTLTVRLELEDGTVRERLDTLHLLRPTWSDPRERQMLLEENTSRLEFDRPPSW